MRQKRIACAKNSVWAKIYTQFRFHGGADVNVGKYPKALFLKGTNCPFDDVIKSSRYITVKCIFNAKSPVVKSDKWRKVKLRH